MRYAQTVSITSFFQSREFGEFQKKIPYRGKSWMLDSHGTVHAPASIGVINSRAGGQVNGPTGETCLVIRQKLRFGKSFLWIPYGIHPYGIHPYGPVPQSGASVVHDTQQGGAGNFMNLFMLDLRKIAEKENAVFARMEPDTELTKNFLFREEVDAPGKIDTSGKVFSALDFTPGSKKLVDTRDIRPAFERYTPEATLVIDLSLSEEEILKQMKPKGRYNIGVAEKHGVRVVRHDVLDKEARKDLDFFYEILKKTAARDGFHCHPKSYYATFLEFFCEKRMASLFIAKYREGKSEHTLGGIITYYHVNTIEGGDVVGRDMGESGRSGNDEGVAGYYYGASDHQYRKLMAPYLLQWEALKEAKKRGMRRYDFFGISPDGPDGKPVKNHPWAGVTEFKKKFGGKIVQFEPAYDIVYQPFWYWIFRLKERLVRMGR